jgi:hypothetical protein
MIRLKQGFFYYLLAVLLEGLLLMFYMQGDPVAASMDAFGWLFFLTSCVGHAAVVMLAVMLLFYVPWALLGWRRVAAALSVGAVSLTTMIVFVNMQVYKIYRFHINGFILNMLTGPGASDIFDFDTKLYLTEGAIALAIIAICTGLWWIAGRLSQRWGARQVKWSAALLALTLAVANACYVYGSFVVKPSVMKSAQLVPYYFPLSATSFMQDVLGMERHVLAIDEGEGGGELCYPLQPLVVDTAAAAKPNIVMILIDSWSRLSLTPECMPHLWQLAHQEQWYQNHVSCGNGTSFSVFGMFTGLQPYYWTTFESNRISPLLVDELLRQGYDFRAYPSASLEDPPFSRMLFQHVPNLRINTPGETAYERDLKIKSDLLADLPRLKEQQKPFFVFIFFDLLHAYSLPKELLNRFQPSWEYGDFARLNNDMDPTPFWNLYRNSAYQTDGMVNAVVERLKELGMYDETLVMITGDHAQEYNENHKNYWGHNSNFTQYQIGVPLIVHYPDTALQQPTAYTHRTTHYDFVPTLMHNYLGVENPLDDYCAGRLLNDTTPRLWHFVGHELRYAFIIEGDTILTKEGAGYVDVTDARLNPVPDYQVKPREFDAAIKRLNRFFKK